MPYIREASSMNRLPALLPPGLIGAMEPRTDAATV